jgi:hypothetical protein
VPGTDAFALATVMVSGCLTIYGVARAFFNRPGKRTLPPAAPDPALQDRLDRLESAIQAIAIETERIAEGQRFTTRLLAQREPSELPTGR